MKKLLIIFVLLFSNLVMSKQVDGDIFFFLNKGYKIISVISPSDKALITFVLSYKNKDIVNCTYSITGVKLYCFSLDKE